METQTESKTILNELQEIKAELHYIRVHLIDVDRVLSDDDLQALDEAREDYKAGKTKRLN